MYLGTGLREYLGMSDTFTDEELSESEIKLGEIAFKSQFGVATSSAAPLGKYR